MLISTAVSSYKLIFKCELAVSQRSASVRSDSISSVSTPSAILPDDFVLPFLSYWVSLNRFALNPQDNCLSPFYVWCHGFLFVKGC